MVISSHCFYSSVLSSSSLLGIEADAFIDFFLGNMDMRMAVSYISPKIYFSNPSGPKWLLNSTSEHQAMDDITACLIFFLEMIHKKG